MRKFIKNFIITLLSVFLLSSCFWEKSGDEISTKFQDIPGENAKFIFNIDAKKAAFLIGEVGKIIPTTDDNQKFKKQKELLKKFKDSNLTFASLSIFDKENSGDLSDIDEPFAILFSNMDKEIISFIKDFKSGVAEKLDKNARDPDDIFKVSNSISEFLKNGNEVGKSFKKELEKSSKEDKKRAFKIVEDIKVGSEKISLIFNPENKKEKLKGFLKDNKGFNEMKKNLKGDEFFYVYGFGDQIQKLSKNQVSLKDFDMESILVGFSANESGTFLNMNYKMKVDITKEQDESLVKGVEAMDKNLKQMVKMYSGFMTASLEESDKEIVNNAIDGLNIKYEKKSSQVFTMQIILKTDMKKLFSVFEKLSKGKLKGKY